MRRMSGVGSSHMFPYIRTDVRFFGHWSTVPDEYTYGKPAPPMSCAM